jgi:hypothetical protein
MDKEEVIQLTEPPNTYKYTKFVLVFVFFIILFGLLIFFFKFRQYQINKNSTKNNSEPTLTPITDTFAITQNPIKPNPTLYISKVTYNPLGWKSYTSPQLPFTFKYPNELTIEKIDNHNDYFLYENTFNTEDFNYVIRLSIDNEKEFVNTDRIYGDPDQIYIDKNNRSWKIWGPVSTIGHNIEFTYEVETTKGRYYILQTTGEQFESFIRKYDSNPIWISPNDSQQRIDDREKNDIDWSNKYGESSWQINPLSKEHEHLLYSMLDTFELK